MSVTLHFCEDVTVDDMVKAVGGRILDDPDLGAFDGSHFLVWSVPNQSFPFAVEVVAEPGGCIAVWPPEERGYNNGQRDLEDKLGVKATYFN